MTQHQPIVIVGSGLAGYMVAKEFRKLDTDTPLTIVTASDGSFYSKPLLSTALTNERTPEALVVSTAEDMAQQLDVTVLVKHMVNKVDPEHRQLQCRYNDNDVTIEFSQLVFACGADKVNITLEGDAVDAIQSVNDLHDYRDFRQWLEGKQRIAMLGSGLVGCEFTNDLINKGYKVDIIAPEQHPLASLVPQPIGDQLIKAFKEQGVNWHMGRFASQVDCKDNGYTVTLSDDSSVEVDGVFSAIGLRPHIKLAQTAGIETRHGVVVNRWLQTNVRNIFALGDCAEVDGTIKQYVAPILQCARALAKILAGGKDPVHYPPMPVVIKTPACPIVSSPPPIHVQGQWHIEGEAGDLRGLFHDEEGQLRGFALVGTTVRDKMALAKQLPLVFEE